MLRLAMMGSAHGVRFAAALPAALRRACRALSAKVVLAAMATRADFFNPFRVDWPELILSSFAPLGVWPSSSFS
jgi:hypothetical protein